MRTEPSSRAVGVVSRAIVGAIIGAIVGVALLSCGPPRGPDNGGPLLGESGDKGCSLFVRKCTRCHEIERIGTFRASTPGQWASLVTRMRRLRGSNINKREGDLITSCLVERQFGDTSSQQGGDPPVQPGIDGSDDDQGQEASDEE